MHIFVKNILRLNLFLLFFFIQGEAVRMVRQRPVHRTREEMSDLLEQLTTSLDPQCASCLHDRPFFTTVYDLCDAPLTQTQS